MTDNVTNGTSASYLLEQEGTPGPGEHTGLLHSTVGIWGSPLAEFEKQAMHFCPNC